MIIDMNCPLGRNASYLLEKVRDEERTRKQKFKDFTHAIECASHATEAEVDNKDIMTAMYLFLLSEAEKL